VRGGSSEKSRLAALVRHGSDPAAVASAREALAAVNVRKAINTQRAALGLPPAASDLEALGYAASLLTKARA
jgi:hypothetical protein